MSYHFYIQSSQPSTYNQILEKLKTPEVQVAYGEYLDLDSEFTPYRKFCIPKLSTRGVQLGLDDGTWDIGINILASKEDYFMALDLALVLAELHNAEILPEDHETPLSKEEFVQQFNAEWVESFKTAGLNAVDSMIKEKQSVLTLGGCFRPFHIGPRLRREIFTVNDSEEDSYQKLITAMRHSQFLEEDLYIPNIAEVNGGTDNAWTYSLLACGNRQLVQRTTRVVLFLSSEQRIDVLFEDFKARFYTPENAIDEEQFIWEAPSETEYAQLIEELGNSPAENSNEEEERSNETQPTAKATSSKPRWKFWKK